MPWIAPNGQLRRTPEACDYLPAKTQAALRRAAGPRGPRRAPRDRVDGHREPPPGGGTGRRPGTARGHHHALEPEPGRLLEAALGVGDVAQLAGQPDLAEAGDRAFAAGRERLVARGRRDRERDRRGRRRARRCAPRLRRSRRRPPSRARRRRGGASTGRIQAQPVAVDAVRDATRRHHVGRRHQRLDLDQQGPGALHRAQHARARHRLGVAQEALGRIGDLVRPPARISKTPISFVEPKRFFTARRMR